MPKQKILSNHPPKGTTDWLPEEFRIRKYIFDTWRDVCVRYGYEEYLTPLVEYADLYRAKSGEDIGGKELVMFTDKAGRELAVRPEMTPSVTRMVSAFYRSAQKPLRLFSIANFMRNEKPQRGRNREFWQLNYDIFGSDSINADIEIAQMALDIILSFNPPKKSFVLYMNNRKLIEGLLDDIAKIDGAKKSDVIRTLDKWDKLTPKELEKRFETAGLKGTQVKTLTAFMESNTNAELIDSLPKITKNKGLSEINQVHATLEELGYGEWIEFKPNIIRGFDYYDGMVYEVFDHHPDNTRAMFGGGRYNGLAQLFGTQSLPAVGFAPGDETIRLFLESWNLLDHVVQNKEAMYYVPVLSKTLVLDAQKLAQSLRSDAHSVETGVEVQKINKALEYANKKGLSHTVIFGENEKEKGVYKIKDMKSGKEREYTL